MSYTLLPWLLQQEGDHFRHIDNMWRPVDLLFLQQTRAMLRDVETRLERLHNALDELRTLNRPDVYVRLLTRMRLAVRQARYSWKLDHLTFIRAIAQFYQDYSTVLRMLRIEEARGRFTGPSPATPQGA